LLRNVLAGKPARANGRGHVAFGFAGPRFRPLGYVEMLLAPGHGIEPRTFAFSVGITSLRDMSLH
jgi:hypothetical protein